MTIQVFQRGETVPIWAENRNWAGTLTNPSQGITITLKKPDGTAAQVLEGEEYVDLTDKAMGKETTPRDGIYVYYYNSSPKGDPLVADPLGWWHYSCKAVDGAGPDARTVITHGSFKLV